MRNTRRIQRWGLVTILGVSLGLALAAEAKTDALVIKWTNVPLNQMITVLAEESGKKIVMQMDRNPDVSVNFPTPTPLEEILQSIAQSQGLDFWKNNDTYYIGTRPAATIDPVPATPAVAATPRVQPSPATQAYAAPMKTKEAPRKSSVVKTITLNRWDAREMCAMLGVADPNFEFKNPQRRRDMQKQVRSVLEKSSQSLSYENGALYSSPATNSPWLRGGTSGAVNRTGSVTDGYMMMDRGYGQFGTPGAFPGGTTPRPIPGSGQQTGVTTGTQFPGQPGTGRTGAVAGRAGAVNPATFYDEEGNIDFVKMRAAQDQQLQAQIYSSPLGSYIPLGIQSILAVPGSNSLMVKAESDEAIDDLEQLIKRLDQPVKQAIVELMFVEMSVNDSMTFGINWDINAFPLTVTNNLGNSQNSSFQMQYKKGNIRARLDAALTNSRGTVVTAPKLLIQNNGTASISMDQTIPIIYVEETEDLAYDVTTTKINFDEQNIGNTFSIDDFLIHPDNSMTITIEQSMTTMGDVVAIPGTSQGPRQTSTQYISTRPHIKNGETMLIGAYTTKNEGNSSNRTPLLGDIPVLGDLLFKSKSKTVNNKDLLIFLTATVLEDDTTDFGGISDLPPLF